MRRSKRVVFLAHCILNGNSKVMGLTLYGGAMKSVVNEHLNKGTGMIQLPCPETTFIGLRRWGMSKNQYDTANYRRHCRNLLIPYVEQMKEYQSDGYILEGIIGIDGSPSCGVNYVSMGYKGGMIDEADKQASMLSEQAGQGIYIEELKKLLNEYKIQVEFLAVDEKAQVE
ncbi:CD3072 family TudS-related putative desulfidase [Desulfuribacillus alkaliarsenatis]|uniref:DUF523 domain-containing protein n=1 Tax=Desulfuribacillus alkaliarsenatis TaxID=766136 RepID=A0A1E5G2X2_9FIRM|nr:CD3072 family TudS-related putative desulfidase [Desulfuribacillus alkaliarsenatis]OEF97417.1 hypothetical protein BHF68_04200 [Desulfuribacillus alkaliarsenatis]